MFPCKKTEKRSPCCCPASQVNVFFSAPERLNVPPAIEIARPRAIPSGEPPPIPPQGLKRPTIAQESTDPYFSTFHCSFSLPRSFPPPAGAVVPRRFQFIAAPRRAGVASNLRQVPPDRRRLPKGPPQAAGVSRSEANSSRRCSIVQCAGWPSHPKHVARPSQAHGYVLRPPTPHPKVCGQAQFAPRPKCAA